ncbi:MAG: SRPBCC family protein [Actinomycetota bacterium]|nr:SRPBCC family protein [Actinomycetota bacterium]
MPVLRLVTDLEAPVEVCFDLSRSIDLHVESMASSRERAISGVTAGLIGAGEEVTWEARHFGVRWEATSRITEYERPRRFVDEMIRGPFASFRHEHQFEPRGQSTRMTDVIEYRTPCGPLSVITDALAGTYLRRLMAMRNATIRSKAEAAEEG